MQPEQLMKIEESVRHCLGICRRSGVPYSLLAEYLESLKSDAHWTDAEIIELQTRVIRELMTG